ncbi:uncharacterized protein RMCC_4697 [Mycolicibacterium canariasense]|uniref:Uncharacterized protein n=1 Tax=Mycolicibacterium canariasense TaxID=228230 RepID=A0A100WGB0_MYCCR|nr:hypothetical protein [Mycolicibacterium canariasense]MCV7209718.1 hypothetical protein [Mycolicibacterium canariasense]ORU99626.1 hypothetical protein AWB94_01925 [Mycolicibacterium canariasense]GAS97731.1 uncharacterized protein RMCC_4697 [Mycolicibacterium canariasense]
MAHYVDIAREPGPPPAHLTVDVDDVLRFSASGAVVREGESVEILGILNEAIVATNGELLAPQGPPNVVLVRACAPGSASLEIIAGDPFQPSDSRRTVRIVVN